MDGYQVRYFIFNPATMPTTCYLVRWRGCSHQCLRFLGGYEDTEESKEPRGGRVRVGAVRVGVHFTAGKGEDEEEFQFSDEE